MMLYQMPDNWRGFFRCVISPQGTPFDGQCDHRFLAPANVANLPTAVLEPGVGTFGCARCKNQNRGLAV